MQWLIYITTAFKTAITNEPLLKKTNMHKRKQRGSNCEADQRQCFRYSYCTIPMLSKFKISSHLLCLYSSVYVGPFQKQHCWFSHYTAHLYCVVFKTAITLLSSLSYLYIVSLDQGTSLAPLPHQSIFSMAGAEMFWPIKPEIARSVGIDPYPPLPSSH